MKSHLLLFGLLPLSLLQSKIKEITQIDEILGKVDSDSIILMDIDGHSYRIFYHARR